MPRLLMAAGAAMIPHPAKQDKGGEDAFFIADHCLGVADGVGGWAEIGVDPGLYSRQLMQFAKDATVSCQPGARGARGRCSTWWSGESGAAAGQGCAAVGCRAVQEVWGAA